MAQSARNARTRKQHYVPQMYLKQFVGKSPANMIWTYDTTKKTWRPSTTENTAVQSNFYSYQQDDGSYLDQIDEWLTAMEGKAAEPFEKLLAGTVPAGQQKADLAVFFAALFCRSPALIRSYAHMDAQWMQVISNFMTSSRATFETQVDRYERANGKIGMSRQKLWEFQRDPSRYYLKVSEKAGLQGIKVTDALSPIFYDRTWTLMVPTEGTFITCDNPVYRWVPYEDRHGVLGDGGFANPRAEVTVALSPKLALLISNAGKPGEIFEIPRDHVVASNQYRAVAAERYLYAHERCDEISALGDQFAAHKQRMRVGDGGNAEIVITR